MRTGAIALACAAALAGCPSVPGPCDIDAAKRVVIDTGRPTACDPPVPAYEGQALLHATCGFGSYCHSEGIDPPARNGAPHGMDFDLEIASLSSDVGDVARLDASFVRVYELRGPIWNEVTSGRMPPGDAGSTILRHPLAPNYQREGVVWDVESVLASEEGRETLRNWLACGNPVIERVLPCNPASALCNSIGFTEESRCASTDDCEQPAAARCDAGRCAPCATDADCVHLDGDCDGFPDRQRCAPPGECVCLSDADCSGAQVCDTGIGACFAALEPTWPAIYSRIIRDRCAVDSCHAGTNPGGDLDMTDASLALARLIRAPAESLTCRLRTPRPLRVVPGDPDASLLVHKLEGRDATGAMVCGERMPYEDDDPLPLQYVDAIREWIAAGALE